MVIWLQVKGNKSRTTLVTFFSDAISLSKSKLNTFKKKFDTHTNSDSHEVCWGSFKWKDQDKSYEVFDKALISHLKEVRTTRNYVYLLFDVKELENPKIDDDAFFVFFNLSGVSKVWMKKRGDMKSSIEQYLYHPGMGDSPYFMDRPIMKDGEWPR